MLKRKRQGLGLQNLYKELRISRKERAKLHGHLKNLETQGIIRCLKGRYFLPVQSDIIRGRFTTGGQGYGFVIPEKRIVEDIFIPARFSRGAIGGDTVEVLYKERGKKGKPEGKILRIVKIEREKIMGLYVERSGQPFVLAFDSPFLEEIPLVSKEGFSPLPGMIISVDRTKLHIAEVLGLPEEPGVDTKVVIQKYGLAESFSKETLMEAEKISQEISFEEREKRKDYRQLMTMTIDGENAQDFDDAVSVQRLSSGNFLLGIHIADVSHYVRPNSFLDREAFERGTSVYFPNLTLPMLPEKLANDVCSLRPREQRLTFSVLLEVDKNGHVLNAEFHPSLIQTVERMTYTSVQKILEGDEEERRKFNHLVPDLLQMRELARLLRERRRSEGSLDFDLIEPELVYKEGELHSVAAFMPSEAHKIIEEFMVAANEAVASYLNKKNIPSIFRVHPSPAISDLESLRESLVHFGLILPKPNKIKSKDLQQALGQAEGKPEEKAVNIQVLRALRLAHYSEENVGHYGLAKKEYTHFTSPIRRYPDLVVHRILKQAIKGKSPKLMPLASVALHSSEQERKADEAEKDIVEWRIFRFLKNKLGDEFTGTIIDINRAGLVVELDDYFVQGLISYLDLEGDYYKQLKGMIVGKRTGKKFEVGERLRVSLVSVDSLLRRMTFILSQERKRNER